MPGTYVFRPIEANLTHNTDFLHKMNPYCSFMMGNTKIKGPICKKGGKHPVWNDIITVPGTNESQILVQIMDKDKITRDDNVGSFMLDLQEVQALGQVSKWYPLTYKNQPAGEIFLETTYRPPKAPSQFSQRQQYGSQQYSQYPKQQIGMGMGTGTGMSQGQMCQQNYSQYQQNQYQQNLQNGSQSQYYQHLSGVPGMSQPGGYLHQEHVTSASCTGNYAGGSTTMSQNVSGYSQPPSFFTEQRQVVQPHAFLKEVEVTETRQTMQEVEVMEPVRVLKDVQYTKGVPVMKQITVTEPEVVVKQIEVMEPRLVTKTIQVIENVPVKKQIETVEYVNGFEEVNTMEPQTFTKQVEVTEYVPVKKQIEVTKPVTLRKDVEFVEPVITTQTITKEMRPEIIIGEETTTTVGPASVVSMSSQAREVRGVRQLKEVREGELTREFGDVRITENKKIFEDYQPVDRVKDEYYSSTYTSSNTGNNYRTDLERDRLTDYSRKYSPTKF